MIRGFEVKRVARWLDESARGEVRQIQNRRSPTTRSKMSGDVLKKSDKEIRGRVVVNLARTRGRDCESEKSRVKETGELAK